MPRPATAAGTTASLPKRRTASVIGERGATSAIGRPASSAASAAGIGRHEPDVLDATETIEGASHLPSGIDAESARTQAVGDHRHRCRSDLGAQLGVRAQEARDPERIGCRDGDDEIGAAHGRERGGVAARAVEVAHDLLVALQG